MALERISRKLNRLTHFSYEAPRITGRDFELSPDDLEQQLGPKRASSLFLGYYTIEQIEEAIRAVGVHERLAKKGYHDLSIRLHPKDRFEHRLDIVALSPAPETLIGQIVLRTGLFRTRVKPSDSLDAPPLDMLFIEWILMQDPRASFTDRRPQLPGQTYPGLGVGRQVVTLLGNMTRTLKKDGILNCPEHFHNAYFYQAYGGFSFFDPDREATLDALRRDLADLSIAEQSHAVHLGCVRDVETGQALDWSPEEQIRPASAELEEYFGSAGYRRQYRTTLEWKRFEVDRRLLAARREKASKEE